MMRYVREAGRWSTSTKVFLLLAVVSLIGIVVRWDHVTREARRGFDYFKARPDGAAARVDSSAAAAAEAPGR